MTIDQAALIQTVYDTIFSTFIQSPQTGKPAPKSREVLLTLEWPGQQLDASEYQSPWSPQNPAGSQFATEMFSTLIDAIPLVDSVYVDSGVTVEEMYEFALGATAVPLPPNANGEPVLNPVNMTLAKAREIFEQSKLASLLHPALSYRASYATPTNWSDEAAAQTWTRININSNQKVALPNSPFVRMGGLKRVQDGVWKLPSATVNSAQVMDRLTRAEILKPSLQSNIQPTVLQSAKLESLRAVSLQNSGLQNPGIDRVKLADLNPVKLERITPNPALTHRLRPELLNQVKLTVIADRPIDKETKDLQISFRCCRVNFTRPWMMKSLLELSGWTLPGQAPGSLSTGTVENNSGTFPVLPIGFLAIRDLEIRANWSKADREIAAKVASSQDAVGFGPFALSGSYAESGKGYTSGFDGVTISAPALQILGWISLVLPYAPSA